LGPILGAVIAVARSLRPIDRRLVPIGRCLGPIQRRLGLLHRRPRLIQRLARPQPYQAGSLLGGGQPIFGGHDPVPGCCRPIPGRPGQHLPRAHAAGGQRLGLQVTRLRLAVMHLRPSVTAAASSTNAETWSL
jgi:hypothetical protein